MKSPEQEFNLIYAELAIEQEKLCNRLKIPFYPPMLEYRIGIGKNFYEDTLYPIHGMRYNAVNGTSGWYLYRGSEDYRGDEQFFKAYHAIHLIPKYIDVLKYFGLPPGYSFTIAPGYEDVYYDEAQAVD